MTYEELKIRVFQYWAEIEEFRTKPKNMKAISSDGEIFLKIFNKKASKVSRN